jgi:hypothetical protein
MHAKNKGFAIVLAWPDTFCKQAGGWYDPILSFLGICQNHYYRVGHAAVVLVNGYYGGLQYFDFGRYHAPFGHGRVRSELTDPELKMNQRAILAGGLITNLKEILEELQNRIACHGEGDLYASVIRINHGNSLKKAFEFQENSPIQYGPFVWNGSNCSRFVNDVVRAGQSSIINWLKLQFPWTLSPTPIGNVRIFKSVIKIPGNRPKVPIPQSNLQTVLPTPNRHVAIPIGAKWISGEGAGSWFHFNRMAEIFIVRRYSPEGDLEFSGVYEVIGDSYFFPESPFDLNYLSHYKQINLVQAGKAIRMSLLTIRPQAKFRVMGLSDIIDNLQLISN